MSTNTPDVPEMPPATCWGYSKVLQEKMQVLYSPGELAARDRQWQVKLDALKADIAHKDAWGEQLSSEFMRHRLASQQTVTALSEVAERLQAENEALRKALIEERRVRLLGHEPNVHRKAMRDIRQACYAATDAAIDAQGTDMAAGRGKGDG